MLLRLLRFCRSESMIFFEQFQIIKKTVKLIPFFKFCNLFNQTAPRMGGLKKIKLLNEPIIKFFPKNIVFFTRYII